MDKKNQPEWIVEKQPEWFVDVCREMITDLDGGYAEAAKWLKTSEDGIFNRLKELKGQVMPLGFAMVLQSASGTPRLAREIAYRSGGSFVPNPKLEEIDDIELGRLFRNIAVVMGDLANTYDEIAEDGVIDDEEKKRFLEVGMQLIGNVNVFQNHALALMHKPAKEA
ncbi:DNA-binding protein [Hafnia alvei]|uniref:YmfL family putative regulatory protein n=1 Tax=Hafnia alvei TaxID=569 RepID=UPI002DB588EE|nr:YmfL family putative regulatory protein [Hafnia alvei]MEB7891000.1 DNA-binding protein [Hafnia alvei]